MTTPSGRNWNAARSPSSSRLTEASSSTAPSTTQTVTEGRSLVVMSSSTAVGPVAAAGLGTEHGPHNGAAVGGGQNTPAAGQALEDPGWLVLSTGSGTGWRASIRGALCPDPAFPQVRPARLPDAG